MKIGKHKQIQKRAIAFLDARQYEEFISGGHYLSLDKNPEVVSACTRIADMISSMTIYLMCNTDKGDIRIQNELSKKVDISPSKWMTRKTWIMANVMNMLLYGEGNAVVYPHTKNGLLDDLEPIEADRVSFFETNNGYEIGIDQKKYDPSNLLHFVWNPDPEHLWKGLGAKATISEICDNLKQARSTENAFMKSKWKPSVVVKVDALADEFSSPEGRKKLLNSYIESSAVGEPWLIPSEQFSVDQIRPLSLADLAINETVTIDKKTIASFFGVPAFVLGVGDYSETEWNAFVNNTVRPIAKGIEQELSRKLLLNERWYFKFNIASLYAYDLQKTASVYGELYVKGIVTGNEVRDKIGMAPKDGLDELILLENYINLSDIGKQSKLNGGIIDE